MKKFPIVFLTVSAISACLNATTTPIELAVESGTATFSTSFLGLLRKTGAGILMLTGINSLTRLDIEEGTVLVCSAEVKSRSLRPEVRSSASENLAISTTSIPTPSIMFEPFAKELLGQKW